MVPLQAWAEQGLPAGRGWRAPGVRVTAPEDDSGERVSCPMNLKDGRGSPGSRGDWSFPERVLLCQGGRCPCRRQPELGLMPRGLTDTRRGLQDVPGRGVTVAAGVGPTGSPKRRPFLALGSCTNW